MALYLLVLVASAVAQEDYNGGGADISNLGTLVYGKPDRESGKLVAEWKGNSGVNPEELGRYVEGDILFPPRLSKNGLIEEASRWTDGVVPYEIDGFFSTREKDSIGQAMDLYHKHTCIRFRRRVRSDPDWVSIVGGNSGCWSSVGRIGGRQEVNLQSPNCFAKIGTVIHELLHAIGFQHEQNRWERDSYVTVHWENVQKSRENNFVKSKEDIVTGFGIPYDYSSVMHYSERAFSKNGELTITVKEPGARIGQREGFSPSDVAKVVLMYNCTSTGTGTNQTVTVGSGEGGNQSFVHGLLSGIASMLLPR